MTLVGLDEQVLMPPEDLRRKIERVVGYVAKDPTLEAKLLQAGTLQTKDVSFLQPGTPYFAYYNQRLYEIRQAAKNNEEESKKSEQTEEAVSQPAELPSPPPAYNWILNEIFSTLSVFELELMKLVAQFVACNGRACQMGLWNRESKNLQFAFLQMQHPYHSLYQILVSQYVSVMKTPIPRSTRSEIYWRIQARKNWKKAQLKTEKDLQAEEEAKRTELAAIDWDSAIIVDNIQFLPNEVLPPPIDQKHISFVYQSLMVRSEEPVDQAESNNVVLQEQQQIDRTLERTSVSDASKSVPDVEKRRPGRTSRPGVQLCPICHQEVPVDEIAEHMKAELSQSAPSRAPEKSIIMATGEDIYKNLSQMTENRSDIFEDTHASSKLSSAAHHSPQGNEDLVADSHAAPAFTKTFPYAHEDTPYRHSQEVAPTMQEQPPVHPTMIMNASAAPLGPPIPPASNLGPPYAYHPTMTPYALTPEFYPFAYNVEPDAYMKRFKTHESIEFISEKDWLAAHPQPIVLHILNATADSTDVTDEYLRTSAINAGHPSFDLQLAPDTTVKDLKEVISKHLSQPIPANKQVLKVENQGFFLKDKHTLAYYNLPNGTFVVLTTRERGGKKK